MATVDLAGRKHVHEAGRTQPVGFDDPQPQVIQHTGRLLVLQHRHSVTVQQEAREHELLEHIEVIEPVCIAGRFVRPQGELSCDLGVDLLGFLVGDTKKCVVDLWCRGQAAAHHVGSHRLDCSCCQRNAHESVSASFSQDAKIIFDVLFRASSVPCPAPHRFLVQAGSIVGVARIDCPYCRLSSSTFYRPLRGNRREQAIKHSHASPPYRSRGTKCPMRFLPFR